MSNWVKLRAGIGRVWRHETVCVWFAVAGGFWLVWPCCRWCSRQSCARACCGASLQRSHCVSTSLRCALSRLHRGTRCVRFALYARTTAMRVLTKRAARAAVKAVLLGAAEARRSPPGRTFAEGWFVVGAKKTRCPYLSGDVPGRHAGPKTNSPHSRESVPGGGDLCGGEEHRAGVGARSALRQHSHCGCPNGESVANKVSSAVPTPARAPQRSRHAVRPPLCVPARVTGARDSTNLHEARTANTGNGKPTLQQPI